MTTESPASTHPVLAAACDLRPILQAATQSMDDSRGLPYAVAQELKAAGVYRLFVPRELGGEEMDLESSLAIIEALSEGSGAAGWNVATSSWNAMNALSLPVEGARRIYASGPDQAIAGGAAGSGQAAATAGGYRLSGHWRFGSGAGEADWMVGLCNLTGDGLDESARTVPHWAFMPRSDAQVHTNWRVAGLKGTGSHDWSVQDRLVPASMIVPIQSARPWPGALYQLPTTSLGGLQFSAVATGIARLAIDSFMELAQGKTPFMSRSLLRDRVQSQEALARAEVLVESARAYRSLIVREMWRAFEAGEPLSLRLRARARLAGAHATECAVKAVDLLFSAGGTTSIQDEHPLSHCFRDVHAVAQNVNVLPVYYEHAGRVLFDLDPGTQVF
jgi:alkylation response protein AidB-like acyl-CoA dehydrogenase